MIDRATLEKIAYRLKHAAGVYQDHRDYEGNEAYDVASTQCLNYADILLDYARSSMECGMSDKCQFESVSPCEGRVAYGACLKHRETFGSARWGLVEDRDVEITRLRARIEELENDLIVTVGGIAVTCELGEGRGEE